MSDQTWTCRRGAMLGNVSRATRVSSPPRTAGSSPACPRKNHAPCHNGPGCLVLFVTTPNSKDIDHDPETQPLLHRPQSRAALDRFLEIVHGLEWSRAEPARARENPGFSDQRLRGLPAHAHT